MSERESELIRELWPEFDGLRARSLGEGWMSRAILVNDEYVFRFAKHPEAAVDTRKEIRLLPQLAPTLSLEIPKFEFVGAEPENSLPVVGYRILPGEPLDEDNFDALSETTVQRIAEQLAQFLDELHAFPVSEAERLGVPRKAFRNAFASDRAELRAAKVEMSWDIANYVERRFSEYLDDEAHFRYTPTLLHADLSCEHLIFDSARQRLTGIIDFGDCSIGDPDYEYLYLFSELGPEFVKRVMKARKEDDSEAHLKKISLFETFDHVHSILGGLHFGRQDLIDEGLAGLASELRWLAEPSLSIN